MSLIQPRTLKGFRDYLPDAMAPREWIIDAARRVYRSYGFRPIDTPALEYAEILTGKGSDETDKQLYRFHDHGDRDVGLRFDLTVPLARFVAQHVQDLGLPFKRYHIATVWRGENTQAGRYREFMQCDFDTIGVTDLTADIETILVANDLLESILDGRPFTIRVNHRAVLNGLLEKNNLAGQGTAVLRALDKLGKIGAEKVQAEIVQGAGATEDQAREVVALAAIKDSNDAILAQLKRMVAGNGTGERGVQELAQFVEATTAAGVPAGRVQLDPSIARGLDYYTGVVFETQLDELPGIGSVASGGRYDNLTAKFSKQQLPGVGGSLGLDRLLAALEELNKGPSMLSTNCSVLVCIFDASRRNDYLKLAAQLRASLRLPSSAQVVVEVYPEATKLGKQLQYADRRKFQVALIMGENEFAARQCQVKFLVEREAKTVPYDGADPSPIIAAIREVFG